MYEFSISIFLDGLIQLLAILGVCGAFYFILPFIANNKFDVSFPRASAVVLAVVTTQMVLIKIGWAGNFIVSFFLMVFAAFGGMFLFFRAPPAKGIILAVLLFPIVWGMEIVAKNISGLIFKGPSFAEYIGLISTPVEENQLRKEKPVIKDLAKLAILDKKEQLETMKADFNYSVHIFDIEKERLRNLSFVEKITYCEEIAAALVTHAIVDGEYALNAVKSASPKQVIALLSLFNKTTATDEALPESIIHIAAYLGGFTLDEQNSNILKAIVRLSEKGLKKEAIAYALLKVEQSKGENALAGALILSMLQAETDLPFGHLILDEESDYFVNEDNVRVMAKQYYERVKKTQKTLTQEKIEEDVIADKEAAPKRDPFIQVSTDLGIITVPNEEDVMHEWIAAAQSLKVKGFVSLGEEIVILNEQNEMLKRGQVWDVKSGEYTYHFRIDKIIHGKVSLSSDGRNMTLE
ncbi:MAG TPA: hypothetical protein VIR63_07120 [Pontiella sp.]